LPLVKVSSFKESCAPLATKNGRTALPPSIVISALPPSMVSPALPGASDEVLRILQLP
jgi:hypothetical protein